MHNDCFARLKLLLGADALQRLQQARVLVLGVGGVGSWAAETLVRSAVGHLTIVDFDMVKASNINRQLLALHSTIGQPKVDAMAQRLLDINPDLKLDTLNRRLTADNVPELLDSQPWSYVIDAIDERPPKVAAIVHCLKNNIPVVSSMGAANKLTTDGIQVLDISKTSGCHLARLVRKALHRQGLSEGLPVVCSTALPVETDSTEPEAPGEKRPLGTIAFLPASFGLKCAEVAIQHILQHTSTDTPKAPRS